MYYQLDITSVLNVKSVDIFIFFLQLISTFWWLYMVYSWSKLLFTIFMFYRLWINLNRKFKEAQQITS